MFPSQRRYYRLAIGAILALTFCEYINGLDIQYCSNINTAGTAGNSSIYQSNGLCYNFCVKEYAFAVLQGGDCWCSNYVPGITTSTGDCSNECPGYLSDTCGGDGTFGYIALTMSPLGTKGASAASSSTSTPSTQVTTSSSSPDAVTVYSTVTESPAAATTSSSSSSSSFSTLTTETTSDSPATTSAVLVPQSTQAAQRSSTDASTSSMWTPTPVVSLQTITGQVRTVTVTPTVPPSGQNVAPVSKSKGGGGLSTGGAVGLTVGLVALVAIIAGIIYFCIRKRRQEKADEYNAVHSRADSVAGIGGAGPVPSRTMSENSRYVLGTDGKRVVETWEPDLNSPGSRKSQLMPVDPRLDPFAPVYQRGENKSRESINTIRDDHDYSRRVHQQKPILRATNPDPD